ncbi:unnamed protein product [Trichobilharzia regenti]|nr:unnamed protein product [Trichobilharzia regenti]
MSAWISRCEERQKRLHLASAERRYQKAMDMERTQLFHPTLSDQYTRRPLSSHLSKVDPCHCGFESGVGGSRRGDRSTWRDIIPSHRSTLSYKTNSGRRSARSGNETRLVI